MALVKISFLNEAIVNHDAEAKVHSSLIRNIKSFVSHHSKQGTLSTDVALSVKAVKMAVLFPSMSDKLSARIVATKVCAMRREEMKSGRQEMREFTVTETVPRAKKAG